MSHFFSKCPKQLEPGRLCDGGRLGVQKNAQPPRMSVGACAAKGEVNFPSEKGIRGGCFKMVNISFGHLQTFVVDKEGTPPKTERIFVITISGTSPFKNSLDIISCGGRKGVTQEIRVSGKEMRLAIRPAREPKT